MKAFGLRVREERTREGLTLEQMSELVGMSAASFQRIEKHCANIPLSLIIDIARQLGVDVGDLFPKTPVAASRKPRSRAKH